MVQVLAVCVNGWRGWDRALVQAHVLAALARMTRDCWAALRNVPIDCVTVDMETVSDTSFLAVHVLVTWVIS